MLGKAWYVTCILSLLVGGTASAECAWILWKHATSQVLRNIPTAHDYSDYWTLEGTFIAYDQCRKAQQGVWETVVKGMEKCAAPADCAQRKLQKVPYNYVSISTAHPTKDIQMTAVQYAYDCIPDTIDPREK